MVAIERITKEMCFRACLDCINKRYHVFLTEDDCLYTGSYPLPCYQCRTLTQDATRDFK